MPSSAEVAAKVGLATTPERDFYDLVVIGGGPGGLGAAVYGASEGLRTLLVEKFATGGQAGQCSRIENYLGFPDGVSGGQLTDRARRQAVKFGAELLTTREATGLEVNGPARTVRLSDGTAIDAKAIILATGVSYRQLNAPGCDRDDRARASTTARRSPRPRAARTRTCTWSAARTRPGRPPSTCPGSPGR